jgi:hypothetical protein
MSITDAAGIGGRWLTKAQVSTVEEHLGPDFPTDTNPKLSIPSTVRLLEVETVVQKQDE